MGEDEGQAADDRQLVSASQLKALPSRYRHCFHPSNKRCYHFRRRTVSLVNY